MIKNTESVKISENMNKTQVMIFTGLLFAIAMVLSLFESIVLVVPVAVPGVKFGLSNIAVMFAIFFLGAQQAYEIAILKAIFIFLTRGGIAGTLSLSGGLLSITCMLLMIRILKEKVTYISISVVGAVTHNLGQFLVISVLYIGAGLWAYLPVLVMFGVIAGIMTAILLQIILPALKRVAIKNRNTN